MNFQQLKSFIDRALAWWKLTLPGRMLDRYGTHQGGTLSSGLAYGLLFAFFAGLWTLVSVLGIVFANNSQVRAFILENLSAFIPGLIDQNGSGVLSTESLQAVSTTLSITGAFTFIAFFVQITGWLASLRGALRSLLDDAQEELDLIVSRLRDAAAVVVVALLFLLSMLAGSVSGGLVDALIAFLHIGGNFTASLMSMLAGFVLAWLVNFALLVVLFRMVAQMKDRGSSLRAALVGAFSLAVMQLLGTRLLGGASSNPLLAPFAAIIGVLIWFNLFAQVLMYCGAYIAERTSIRELELHGNDGRTVYTAAAPQELLTKNYCDIRKSDDPRRLLRDDPIASVEQDGSSQDPADPLNGALNDDAVGGSPDVSDSASHID